MEPAPATSDDGPEKTNIYLKHFFFSLFVIALASCRQHSNKPVQPPPDTSLHKQRIQQLDGATKTRKKKIYLTFDDGPNKGTRNVLKAVKEENIAASFFIVGKHVFDSPEQTATWNELTADSTIELCNHSYTHALNRYSKFYSQPEKVVADIQLNQEKLHFKNKVVRMPGRNAWRIDTIDITDIYKSKTAIDSVHKAGFVIMGWDIEWTFNHKTLLPDQDTAALFRKIFNLLDAGTTKAPGHLVLLAHDQAFQNEASLAMLVSFLKELKQNNGYDFTVASQYPGVKK